MKRLEQLIAKARPAALPSVWGLLVLVMVGSGFFWEKMISDPSQRAATDGLMGRLPKPTEPSLFDPVIDLVSPQTEYSPMRVTHIPRITMGDSMPHPYVGVCINCHLINGGAAAGTQDKTPIGALYEAISENVVKLGPPIKATSERPHPAAGRCIKCHDLIVMQPVEKGFFRWK